LKIIDAHIHYHPENEHFTRLAEASGHRNTREDLERTFALLGIERAVVMSNHWMPTAEKPYPPFVSYCVGINEQLLQEGGLEESLAQAESHLRQPDCCGVKIYAGYSRIALMDPMLQPFYELAGRLGKPVAFHMGVTASPRGLLKYSQPIALDEVATAYPKLQLVMCHFGNPWLGEAAAVMEKNPNVAADLSGLLIARANLTEYLKVHAGYAELLKTWIAYVENYERFLYGTDWPLANMGDYVRFVQMLIPEKHWEKVFYENARRVYQLN